MAMLQRDETIEEIKRLDALLEYAVMNGDEAEAARLRAELTKFVEKVQRAGFAAVAGFAADFAWLKRHFPAAKIFYDLRLDLRFVCYNGCELNDKDMD